MVLVESISAQNELGSRGSLDGPQPLASHVVEFCVAVKRCRLSSRLATRKILTTPSRGAQTAHFKAHFVAFAEGAVVARSGGVARPSRAA